MRRIISTELLDHDLGKPEEVRASLNDLWLINRRLGGVSSSLCLLTRFFARSGPHPVRILDVGAGDSRLAAQLRVELSRRGISAEFVATDIHLTHLSNGTPRNSGVGAVVSDAAALPFAQASFNIVMCNLFFHHFSGDAARTLLHSMARVAREAVLINDLERHFLPYLFTRIIFRFGMSRLTRHDGPASVRQAYTRDELSALAESAGFRNFEVERIPPFRLGMTIWK